MSEKPCSKDCGHHSYRRWLYIAILKVLLAIVLLVAFVILVIYLVLHPHKPKFYLQDARVNQFNLTPDGYLTSSIQFTILSHNPNDKVGVYYDRVDVYSSYRGQQISYPVRLQPFYQGHDDDVVFSPVLTGNSIALAPYLCNYLNVDLQYAAVHMNVKLDGKIRWKVGTWRSGHYSLNVNCYALLGLTGSNAGVQSHLQPGTVKCDVDV